MAKTMNDQQWAEELLQNWPIPDQDRIDQLLTKYVLISRKITDEEVRMTLFRIYEELAGYLGADTNNQIDNMRETLYQFF